MKNRYLAESPSAPPAPRASFCQDSVGGACSGRRGTGRDAEQ